MRFFELYFNLPSSKENISEDIFNSFCFSPENINEKKLGYLLVVAELKNVLPQNIKLLDEISFFIKDNYYNPNVKSLPENSLKKTLKKTNSFLEDLTKKGNVNWLGNLNIAALSLTPQKKGKVEINFTKTGDIKILLIRREQITDIGKNLEQIEIDPYPLKIFTNIVSGKLVENDIIAILTKEVFDYFQEKDILKDIAKIYNYGSFGSELKLVLKKYEQELKRISGVCLLCLVSQQKEAKKENNKNYLVNFKKEKEIFSFSKLFRNYFISYRNLFFKKIFFSKKLKLFLFKKESKKNKASLIWLRNKKIIHLILIIFLLLIGFFLFR